jgi:hypothetical protein
MATLANQGIASQASFGQLGSAFLDTADDYTPPAGKVVVAISFLADASLDTLTPEATGDCFGIAANSGQGTNNQLLSSGNVFPKGMTIYGRWTSVSLAAAANTAGLVLYLGPAKHPVSTS